MWGESMIPFWIIGIVTLILGVLGLSWNIMFGLILMAAGVVMTISYVLIVPKYPVSVMVFVERHGNMRLLMDKASRIEIEHGSGTFKYKFKKLKGETKAAVYKNLYPAGKGEIALFYSPAPGEFYQAIFNKKMRERTIEYIKDGKTVEATVKEAVITPVPDNLLEWMILKQQRMKQKYMTVSLLDKFMPIIVIAVLAIVIVIIITSLFQGMGPIVEGFQLAASQLAGTSEKLAEVAEKLALEGGGSQTATPEPPPNAPPDLR